MIHSIEFKDVRDIVEKAKRDARAADLEYDKEYDEYLHDRAEFEKMLSDWEKAHEENPDKYPDFTRPRNYRLREMDKRTCDSPYEDFLECSYINALESLNGRKFEFSPGLNVIVGSNGAGKTSMLKVIRRIFFCEGGRKSELRPAPFWKLSVPNDVVPMLEICDLRADYRRCAYNMLCDGDIDKREVSDVATFLQVYEGMRASNGERGIIALNTLLKQLGEKCDLPIEDDNHPWGMAGSVLSCLISGLSDDEWGERMRQIVDYYDAHQVDDEKFSVIMDEPDSGFDVFRAKILCDLLERMANDADRIAIQPIVALHNVAIISRLMKNPKVNFIELTPGYMDAVRKFDI